MEIVAFMNFLYINRSNFVPFHCFTINNKLLFGLFVVVITEMVKNRLTLRLFRISLRYQTTRRKKVHCKQCLWPSKWMLLWISTSSRLPWSKLAVNIHLIHYLKVITISFIKFHLFSMEISKSDGLITKQTPQ